MSGQVGRRCYAIGPTLQQEARWGIDGAIGRAARFMFIQFKRAIPERGGYRYELNRTKQKDQHEKLCKLEDAGWLVRYAFPLFHELTHIAANRGWLLTRGHMAWYRPKQLPIRRGTVGHHDMHIHGRRCFVTTQPVEAPQPEDIGQLMASFREQEPIKVTNELAEKLSLQLDDIFGMNEGTQAKRPIDRRGREDGLGGAAIFSAEE